MKRIGHSLKTRSWSLSNLSFAKRRKGFKRNWRSLRKSNHLSWKIMAGFLWLYPLSYLENLAKSWWHMLVQIFLRFSISKEAWTIASNTHPWLWNNCPTLACRLCLNLKYCIGWGTHTVTSSFRIFVIIRTPKHIQLLILR